jgi:hypothetical protein
MGFVNQTLTKQIKFNAGTKPQWLKPSVGLGFAF